VLPAIESIRASAYTVPTDEPESDGTLAWDSTTIVVVEAEAAGVWATPTPTSPPSR
jgi:hypothetical protein